VSVVLKVPVPFAPNVKVPLAGLSVRSVELVVAVTVVLSAKVVEFSVNVTDCDPPGASETAAGGVIVYAGAVTVCVVVPLDEPYNAPEVGVKVAVTVSLPTAYPCAVVGVMPLTVTVPLLNVPEPTATLPTVNATVPAGVPLPRVTVAV
jgi:hypothetical protein